MVVDSVANSKVDTVAVVDSEVAKLAKLATPVADTDTCRETAMLLSALAWTLVLPSIKPPVCPRTN